MTAKKKRSFFQSLDRWFRLVVIFMAKDMTLKNPWALFLGPTAAGIVTWMVIPRAFHYAYFEMPIISPMLQRSTDNPMLMHKIIAYSICAYLTYVLLKPFCRGLVVTHPTYFNEGSLR